VIPPELDDQRLRRLDLIEDIQKSLQRTERTDNLSSATNTVNILLIGRTGNGKSSFINTLYSSLEEQYYDIAFSSRSPQSVTKEITQIRLFPNNDSGSLAVNLWDSFGIEQRVPGRLSLMDTNYASCLECLLGGNIGPGFRLEEAWNEIDTNSPHYTTSPSVSKRVHVIAFIYAATSVEGNDDNDLLQQFFRKCIDEYQMKPMVILTHCDEYYSRIFPNSRETIRDILQSSALQELTSAFIRKSGNYLQKGDIRYFANYTAAADTKDYQKEILALTLLKRLLSKAISHLLRGPIDIKVKEITITANSLIRIERNLTTLSEYKLEDSLDQINQKLKNMINGPFRFLNREKVIIPESDVSRKRIRDIATVSREEVIIEVTSITERPE